MLILYMYLIFFKFFQPNQKVRGLFQCFNWLNSNSKVEEIYMEMNADWRWFSVFIYIELHTASQLIYSQDWTGEGSYLTIRQRRYRLFALYMAEIQKFILLEFNEWMTSKKIYWRISYIYIYILNIRIKTSFLVILV